MKNITVLTILLTGIALFSSCDKDHLFDPKDTEDGVVQIISRDYTRWVFFSFEKGDTIGSCDAQDVTENADWKKRTDWDIAFHRQDIKTNSGVSGDGDGGIIAVEQDEFDFKAVTQAPELGYQVDKPDSVYYDMSGMAGGSIGYAYTGTTSVTDNWVVLKDMMTGNWVVTPKVYVVKTGTGNYAKIYLRSFLGDDGASGMVTMQYVYQPDGSIYFNEESK